MKIRMAMLALIIALMTAPVMAEPYAHEASPDMYKVLFENEHVRVLEMVLKPGDRDEWHKHPNETVYFASAGQLTIRVPGGGVVTKDLPEGAIMWHEEWTHQVENTGTTTVRAIIVEDVYKR